MTLVDLVHGDDGVTELVLNRPEKLNAFNADMLAEFSAAVDELGADDRTRCVLLRGEGRAFSVGYDVQRPAGSDGQSPAPEHDAWADWQRLRKNLERWLAVWDLDKPVVAAVQGHCVGGASMLCVCADLTIVAEDATIAWPSVPLGGGLLSPVSLWLVGMKRARELSYIAGSGLSGTEAVELGWANRAVPADQLLDHSREMCARIARTPASLLRLKKLALNRVMETQGFRTAFLYGAEWDAIAHTVPEHQVMRAKIRELGLKDAITWFDEGGDLSARDASANSEEYV
jgi:enoyl-CoA hydratase